MGWGRLSVGSGRLSVCSGRLCRWVGSLPTVSRWVVRSGGWEDQVGGQVGQVAG